MKVKELIEALQNYDPDMSVHLEVTPGYYAEAEDAYPKKHSTLGEIVVISTP